MAGYYEKYSLTLAIKGSGTMPDPKILNTINPVQSRDFSLQNIFVRPAHLQILE